MTKRFEYKIVAKTWGTGGVEAVINPTQFRGVTVHHSAVYARTTDNPEVRAKTFAYHHRHNKGYRGIAYHIAIFRKPDNYIYITNWLNGITWHNSNWLGNHNMIAVLVDGDYTKQSPSNIQLQKLRQILDDLANNWFSENGWIKFDQNINPRINERIITVSKTWQGFTKWYPLNGHKEVAQAGHTTACPGRLMTYVKDYRLKQGKVSWGAVTPPPPPKPKCEDQLKACQNTLAQKEAELKEMSKQVQQYIDRIKQLEATIQEQQSKIQEQGKTIMELGGAIKQLKGELVKCKQESNICSKIKDFVVKLLRLILEWLGKGSQKA